jgi:uncharacterized protein YbbK (DUF523 family)
MENLLISACLMGFECKYSGGSNKLSEEALARLKAEYRLIPVCPETAGGLPVPRDPSERLGGKVVSSKGKDVTAEFEKGADVALTLAKRYGCKKALLKRNSPSCGGEFIYDGSFSGTLVSGQGVTAELLRSYGLEIIGE